jgi:hypothetical protein
MGYRQFTTVYELIDYLRMFSPDAPVYIRDTLDHLYDATCDTGEILIDKESNVRSPVISTCGEPYREVNDADVHDK